GRSPIGSASSTWNTGKVSSSAVLRPSAKRSVSRNPSRCARPSLSVSSRAPADGVHIGRRHPLPIIGPVCRLTARRRRMRRLLALTVALTAGAITGLVAVAEADTAYVTDSLRLGLHHTDDTSDKPF